MTNTAQLPIFQSTKSPSETYPSFHFIKYMGSKREIVDWVATNIDGVFGGNSGTVLDLMAGTAAVSYALSGRHNIIANDIQQYSSVISRTLLQTACEIPRSDAVWTLMLPYFEQNRKTLQKSLRDHIEAEAEFVNSGVVTRQLLQRYEQFQSQYPHAGNFAHSELFNGLGAKFSRLLASRKENRAAIPYCLFTTYFANAYFGLGQAIDVDSFRYAIDSVLPQGDLRWLALSCLMHAASYCTPGPGHFAQFRALNSIAVCEDILRYRGRSVKDYFLKKWDEFGSFHRKTSGVNICSTLDYRDALAKYLPESDVVYVDPPYSFVHYSRFYHALETLVRYDYPESEFYGRYRTDRHQSPFCIRVRVAPAFLSIIEPAAVQSKTLIFSYSNSGMIKLPDLKQLCETRFRRVEIKTNDYLHATMGRRGDKHREVKEALVICRN